MNTVQRFKRGNKVMVNGNKQARILGYYDGNMVEVRLWNGFRHVGDVCVDQNEIVQLDKSVQAGT